MYHYDGIENHFRSFINENRNIKIIFNMVFVFFRNVNVLKTWNVEKGNSFTTVQSQNQIHSLKDVQVRMIQFHQSNYNTVQTFVNINKFCWCLFSIFVFI